MIGLLDPALFLPRDEVEVRQNFDAILRCCAIHSIAIPMIEEYWYDLWMTLGQSFEKTLLNPDARRAVQEVRKLGERSVRHFAPLTHEAGRAWRRGFRILFDPPHLPAGWGLRMASALIRAVATGEQVVLLTRRMPSRNIVVHVAGKSTLDENLRWMLHVQPSGIGPCRVLCVHHPRNLIDRWTCRFDWRLPGPSAGATHPFCPPDAWWKGATIAFRTLESKHAWLDKRGFGWARPSIESGAGHHWDVYITDKNIAQAVGLDQINVVQFGSPSSEGIPGTIHHVPGEKQGKLSGKGWSC